MRKMGKHSHRRKIEETKKNKDNEKPQQYQQDSIQINTLNSAQKQKFVEIEHDDKIHYLSIGEDLDIKIMGSFDLKSINNDNAQIETNSSKCNHFNQKSNQIKLPDVNIEVIENDGYPWMRVKNNITSRLPNSYVKYIDKTIDELDDEIEYDIDEEDLSWLKLVNKQRKSESLSEISKEQFIQLMDRLEKKSYFQLGNKNSNKDSSSQHENEVESSPNKNNTSSNSNDEDELCCICLDGECFNSNAILFCDMCNLAVHQECYGVPYIPEGQWLCRRCIQSPSNAVSCILCPNRYGAFKQTDNGEWAHMICAIWIPEVHFANTVFLEPIIGIENIEQARWKLNCYICRKRNVGACIQCDKANCYTAFHVTCGQQAGLYMKIEDVHSANSPSSSPSSSALSSSLLDGGVNEVRKVAYCDVHTPLEALSPRTRIKTAKSNELEEKALKRAQNQRIKRARKILAEKRIAAPTVSLPVLPKEAINEISESVNIEKKVKFIQLLVNYWLLKRQSRNGVPLIRRLQNQPGLSSRKSFISHYNGSSKNGEVNNKSGDDRTLKEQLLYWKKLRQDLEKARLLMELIRKRERLKRENIKLSQIIYEYQLKPYSVFLHYVLDQLKELDKAKIFHEPVNTSEIPDYLTIIKEPMDFKTISNKIEQLKYNNFNQFEYDFNLIIQNCLKFNENNSYYYKAAIKLKEQGMALLKRARRVYESVGYNETSGIHIENNNNNLNSFNTIKNQLNVNNNLLNKVSTPQKTDHNDIVDSCLIWDDISLEDNLQLLLESLDLANTHKNAGSRSKWARRLKFDITIIKRKISSKMNNCILNDNNNMVGINDCSNKQLNVHQTQIKILKNKNSNSPVRVTPAAS